MCLLLLQINLGKTHFDLNIYLAMQPYQEKISEEKRIEEENRRIKEWERKFDEEQRKKEEELIRKFYSDESYDKVNNSTSEDAKDNSEDVRDNKSDQFKIIKFFDRIHLFCQFSEVDHQ